ncbi:Hypothetical predicted protein [Prunus dulcis]|uniref:Uncharacterized protein n=1 Tax=Prunus dulcis TaxID=3755 RepID=A0A5E4F7X8_PRUDU|nr:Hypothetical predicted protein [Prunus dulcis]
MSPSALRALRQAKRTAKQRMSSETLGTGVSPKSPKNEALQRKGLRAIVPNAYCGAISSSNGESSDDDQGTDNKVLEIDSVVSEGANDEGPELENVDDRDLQVPSIDQENLKTAIGALSLATVPCGVDVEAAAESSFRPILTAEVVCTGNPRIPMGQSKGPLFGVDYLDPNKLPIAYTRFVVYLEFAAVKLVGEEEMTSAREMSESSKQRLMVGNQVRQ